MREAEREVRHLERTRSRLVEELAAVDAGDHRRLASVGLQVAEVEAQLDEAEELWLALGQELEG